MMSENKGQPQEEEKKREDSQSDEDSDPRENREEKASEATSESAGYAPRETSWVGAFVKGVLSMAILSACLWMSYQWMTDRPRAKRRKPPKSIPVVKTEVVEKKSHPITIYAMGSVMAAEKVEIAARVSGMIIEVDSNLRPGGKLAKGEVLARIDPSDYKVTLEEMQAALDQARHTSEERKLAIEQAGSEVARARKNLKLELGQQEIARREYKLLTETKNGTKRSLLLPEKVSKEEKELILRGPQLEVARAELAAAIAGRKKTKVAYQNSLSAVKKAQTALERAQLDLERTSIEVPFNAVVERKNIGKGSNVSMGTSLASLINTESYWIEAKVPVSKLKWIEMEGKEGARAHISHQAAWGPGLQRMGRVISIGPSIEEEGRMARVIVEIKDPLCLKKENKDKPTVMLSSYLDIEISGKRLDNAIKIPRSALREGNQVWIITEENTLAMREVQIAMSGPDHLYISSGLKSGDEVIVGDVPTPVEGMELQSYQKKKKKVTGRPAR